MPATKGKDIPDLDKKIDQAHKDYQKEKADREASNKSKGGK